MIFNTNFLRKLEKIDPDLREILYTLIEEIEKNREALVDKKDFNDLKQIVTDLGLAVKELAEAQKRTEARVEELAEAQKRTEAMVEQLVEAQRKTEEVVKRLVTDMDDVKKQVSGLSMAVGYGIEDKLIPVIPRFIKNEFGYTVISVERENIVYPDGSYDEVNILVDCRKDKRKIYMVGECKAQPSKKDVQRLSKLLERLGNHFKKPVEGFLVGYVFSPEVEKYMRENYPKIKFYKTYQIERISHKK